jgi:hypothetical protein
MASSGMLRRVTLVRTDVSEELSASVIRVTRIGELGTTLTVTSNRRTLRRNTKHLTGMPLVEIWASLFQPIQFFCTLSISWYFFAAYVDC